MALLGIIITRPPEKLVMNIFLIQIIKNGATLKKNYEKRNKAKIVRGQVNRAWGTNIT